MICRKNSFTDLISAIVKRSTRVHIIPSMSFRFPSMISTWKKVSGEDEFLVFQLGHTLWTNVGQLDTSLSNKFKGLVYILGLLNSHSGILVIPPERSIPLFDL